MRPEKLTLCGLGSYTKEETIDFTGKNFIAIVGDTGAGKSTILEAICYALYNRCTYANTSFPLIADGGNGTMSVTLTFAVGNRRWQVARSASRDKSTPVQRLTCLDTGILTIGAKAVTAEIQRIIGLDYDTFLRAVVLPQGRFQELLRMNDRERAHVLDSVLGLDQLVQVREHAKTLQGRLKDRLAEYRLHRRRFLDDPAAALTAATDQHNAHKQRLQRLEQARRAITGARADQQRAATAASALAAVKETLPAAIPAGAAEQLHTLAGQARTLDGQRTDISQLINHQQIEQDLLREHVAQAEQHGGTVSGTATAISTLANLGEQIPQQRKRTQQVAENATAIAAEQVTLREMQQKAAALEPGVAAADKTYSDADTALTQVRQRRERATGRLKTWREKVAELQNARTELAYLEQAFSAAQDKANEAKGLADQAKDEQDQSEHTHTALTKASAAAAAAADLEPGAACITCSRPLPADFTPPAVPDLTTADVAREKARARAEKTGRAAAVAADRVATLKDESLPAARQRVTTAETVLNQALLALREVVADADLSGTDEQILKQLVDDTATAEGDLNRAREARDEIRQTATGA